VIARAPTLCPVFVPPAPPRAWLATAENLLLSVVLAALIVLPLAEIAARSLFQAGIFGVTTIVQHLTLAAGMLGAAVAARENRLLSLATATLLFSGRGQEYARFVSGACAAAVTGLLGIASAQFVLAEKNAGALLVHGFPVWIVQLVLPLGFAAIAVRLAGHASDRRDGRMAAALLAGAIVLGFAWSGFDSRPATVIGFSLLIAATLLGAPVFVALGGAALLLFWREGLPIASIPLDHYRLVVNPSLPAIPLFTLAGYFLAESGAPRRLVRVFHALFQHVRGSAAVVTVIAGAFFTTFTGASGVTILALGGLLMPLLAASGYRERDALGLITTAGSLGVLLPPALPLILYAIVAKVRLEDLFLGGIVPGILTLALVAWWGVRRLPPGEHAARPVDWREVGAAARDAKWELALPLVAFGGLMSGIATPVEVAALTALYALVVATVIHRDLKPGSDVPRVMSECGLLIGGVLLILGVALGFTNFLVDAQIPDRAVEWVTGTIESRWVFLLALNAFLLVAGCLMDIFSATIVLAPLIVPIGMAFGIDPIHLGIIFLANLELGYLTPPVGMNLLFASYRFGKPFGEVCRSVLAPLAVLGVALLLITYLPSLTTALPGLLR